MRSRRSRLLLLALILTAALFPGAAFYVQEAHACVLIQPQSPADFVADSEVVVIGAVASAAGDTLVFEPEAFLKGPVSTEPLRFSARRSECPVANLHEGDRALLYVADAADPGWPLANMAYVLRDGKASREGEPSRTETEVVNAVRAITGQYAVPAASADEGAGIDWGSTVLPLGAALLVVFAIGLVLMRVWHRIDPS